jgi:CheY-like chemotaxis protein
MAEILLIDDMAGVRHSIEVMLKGGGHRVTTATNGAEGLQCLKVGRFDLVLVDMMMPVADGTEVLFGIDAVTPRPKVIAMSGGATGVSATEALRMARFKADTFIEKPFERNEIKALIDRLLPQGK